MPESSDSDSDRGESENEEYQSDQSSALSGASDDDNEVEDSEQNDELNKRITGSLKAGDVAKLSPYMIIDDGTIPVFLFNCLEASDSCPELTNLFTTRDDLFRALSEDLLANWIESKKLTHHQLEIPSVFAKGLHVLVYSSTDDDLVLSSLASAAMSFLFNNYSSKVNHSLMS